MPMFHTLPTHTLLTVAGKSLLVLMIIGLTGFVGCADSSSTSKDLQDQPSETDGDQDGVLVEEDCDDADADIGGPGTFFADTDGDAMGDPAQTMEACAQPEGFVGNSDDSQPNCATNDNDICGVCGGPGLVTWYADVDGDGLGDPSSSMAMCDQPNDHVANSDDLEPNCATNDTDDCGVCGGPGQVMWYADTDGDALGDPATEQISCTPLGEGFVNNGDDLEPNCATNDTDMCGICAGPGGTVYYADFDGDGLGDPAAPTEACELPDGFVTNSDDTDPGCFTNDTDACGVCAGPGQLAFFADLDGDGMGDAASMLMACEQPIGYVIDNTDPEPGCITNNTDECDVCGGENADKDCRGVCFGNSELDGCGICAGPGLFTFYEDADGDALGDPAATQEACSRPEGYVSNSDDLEPNCTTNDTDGCGICAGPGVPTWYADIDGDELGDIRTPLMACDRPEMFVDNSDDLEPDCVTNDTDVCEVCGGGNADLDCNNDCFGTAFVDLCNRCVGGTTGLEAATDDEDDDGVPDLCDPDIPGSCLDESRFIVQWTGVPTYTAGGTYTFQVILFESGNILFQYGILDGFQAVATTGIQSANGVNAIEFGHNSNFIQEQPTVIMFRDAQRNDRYIADYAQPMYWLDISRVGTRIDLLDDGLQEVELGFDFPLYGDTFSSTTVAANGFLGFSEPFGGYRDQPIPDNSLGAMIAPLWDDLNPGRAGEIYVYTSAPTCERDCNGVVGGLAFSEPACGSCVTGPEAGPTVDCAGVCGGTASVDGCGICAGGNTGIEMQDFDCAGECGGEAFYDACRVCVGGTTGLEPSDPATCPSGVDLIVDEPYLADTVFVDYINVSENDCLINEGCVRGSGQRKLIRFGTRIANIGNEDLQLGVPQDGGDFWHFDECHNHYHYEAYAAYQLFDVAADEMLDIGSKNGFCVIDIGVYDSSITDRCNGYTCGNQGITAGCQDTYSSGLQCQWIDVTGLPDGEYDVVVTTNPQGELPELSLENNSASVRVQMTGDNLTVLD